MVNRRDFLKAGAAAGTGLLNPGIGRAAGRRVKGKGRIDFQAFMPARFDGKSFGLGDLIGPGR